MGPTTTHFITNAASLRLGDFFHRRLQFSINVNCCSLNSVGPGVEKVSGPKRYIAQYVTSAIASSAISYWLSKAPAVGASGAIFGLAIGLLTKGIDNWGHLGGLIGGAATSLPSVEDSIHFPVKDDEFLLTQHQFSISVELKVTSHNPYYSTASVPADVTQVLSTCCFTDFPNTYANVASIYSYACG